MACAVTGCKKFSWKKNKGEKKPKYFRFPNDKELCDQWIEACVRKEPFNCKTSRICSKHFTPDDYSLKDILLNTPEEKRRLNPNAVPTQNLPFPYEPLILDEVEQERRRKQLVKESIEYFEKQETPNNGNNTEEVSEAQHSRSEEIDNIAQPETEFETVEFYTPRKKEQQDEIPEESPNEYEESGKAIETSKCGEILRFTKGGNLILLCSLCNDLSGFCKLKDFAFHLEEVHFRKEAEINVHENPSNLIVKTEIVDEHSSPSATKSPRDYASHQFQDKEQIEQKPLQLENSKTQLLTIEKLDSLEEVNENYDDTEEENEIAPEDQENICVYCSKVFTTYEKLIKHEKIHWYKGFCNCTFPNCKASFVKNCSLQSHIAIVHNKEERYKCTECNKNFTCKRSLTQHNLRHLDLKQYSCDICSKKFITKHVRDNHLRTHTGERPFQCEKCGLKFRYKGNFNRHLEIHEKEKKYECDQCSKKFWTKDALHNHKFIHSEGKAHQCNMCQRAFKTRIGLRSHQRLHFISKSYTCSFCEEIFNNYFDYRTHVSTTHKVNRRKRKPK